MFQTDEETVTVFSTGLRPNVEAAPAAWDRRCPVSKAGRKLAGFIGRP
jgi:hypothetical protein